MKPLYIVAVDTLAVAYENGDDPQKDYADYYAQKKEAPIYAALGLPIGSNEQIGFCFGERLNALEKGQIYGKNRQNQTVQLLV